MIHALTPTAHRSRKNILADIVSKDFFPRLIFRLAALLLVTFSALPCHAQRPSQLAQIVEKAVRTCIESQQEGKHMVAWRLSQMAINRYRPYVSVTTDPEAIQMYDLLLDICAMSAKTCGQYALADSCYHVLLTKAEADGDKEKIVSCLTGLADVAGQEEHYAEARQLLVRTRDMVDEGSEAYYDIQMQLIGISIEAGDDDTFLDVFRSTMTVMESEQPVSTNLLSTWATYLTRPVIAETDFRRLMRLIDRQATPGDVRMQAIRAKAYTHYNQPDKAMAIVAELEPVVQQMDSPGVAEVSDELSAMYSSVYNFHKAYLYYYYALQAAESMADPTTDIIQGMHLHLGSLLSLQNRYTRALSLFNSLYQLSFFSPQAKQQALAEQMNIHLSLGDTQQATAIAHKLLATSSLPSLRYNALSAITQAYVTDLDLRNADSFDHTDPTPLRAEAIGAGQQLLAFCDSTYGPHHDNTVVARLLLASIYGLAGDTLRLVSETEKSEDIIRKYYKNADMRTRSLDACATNYLYARQAKRALPLINASDADNTTLPFLFRMSTLQTLCEAYLQLGKTKKAQQNYDQLAALVTQELATSMPSLSAQARQAYWRQHSAIFTDAPKYVQTEGKPDARCGVAYDMTLYAKELLIGSDRRFVQAVRATGDTTMLSRLQHLQSLRTQITSPTTNDPQQLKAQQQLADELERDLLTHVPGLRSAINQQTTSWKTIRQSLDDDALAMEMTVYRDQDNTPRYAAFLIRKTWQQPIMVRLGKKDDIDRRLSAIPNDANGKLCWSAIMPFADGVKTIYIAPAGIFHRIPLEYMPYGNHAVMADDYRICRLSSTARITDKASDMGQGIVVYGGLAYSTSVDSLVADARRYPTVTRGDLQSVALDACTHRAQTPQLSFLPGTLAEADSIVALARQTAANTLVFRHSHGTETSFKALSGQHRRIIHIGTHGFWSDRSGLLTSNAAISPNADDLLLTHSGLYMAGAQHRLNGDPIPPTTDDGVLTAQEIATLDLTGLDLVSLSACQTAQGHITGDGVFGLQRGFKKAGARSILMSLWKVDDNATACLMTEFYRHLFAGRSKTDALRMATDTVRSHPKWSNPRYWAAFVLLDAVEQ